MDIFTCGFSVFSAAVIALSRMLEISDDGSISLIFSFGSGSQVSLKSMPCLLHIAYFTAIAASMISFSVTALNSR